LEIVKISNYGEVLMEWSQPIFFFEQMEMAIEGGALEVRIETSNEAYASEELLINFNVTEVNGK